MTMPGALFLKAPPMGEAYVSLLMVIPAGEDAKGAVDRL